MNLTFLSDYASYIGNRNISPGDTLTIQFLMNIIPFSFLDKSPPISIKPNMNFKPKIGVEQIFPDSHIYKISGKIIDYEKMGNYTILDCGFPLLTQSDFSFMDDSKEKIVFGYGELYGIYYYDVINDDSLKCYSKIMKIDLDRFSLALDNHYKTLPLPLITVTINKTG